MAQMLQVGIQIVIGNKEGNLLHLQGNQTFKSICDHPLLERNA